MKKQIAYITAVVAIVGAIAFALTFLPRGTTTTGIVSVTVVDSNANSSLAAWMARGMFLAMVAAGIIASLLLLVRRKP
jgi:hypothetical protein